MTLSPPRTGEHAAALRALLRGAVRENEPLSRHTTLGIGGPADLFTVPGDRQEFSLALAYCREHALPVLPLGAGSNLLVRDGGYRGVVIHTAGLHRHRFTQDPPGATLVAAEGGVPLPRLLAETLRLGLAGLEFAAGIPGTVGGAVAMNAGAWGREVADILVSVLVVDEAGVWHQVPREAIRSGYRSLELPRPGLVGEATLRLTPGDSRAVAGEVDRLLQERRRRFPADHRNAGSVFRNPPGDHAGRLIDVLGFKGRVRGDAMVSPRHANVIVNRGNARAADVLDLMEEIREAVRQACGVLLEPELRVVGEP
jgi:UDP-N-acetylmuramate dehydrogenase